MSRYYVRTVTGNVFDTGDPEIRDIWVKKDGGTEVEVVVIDGPLPKVEGAVERGGFATLDGGSVWVDFGATPEEHERVARRHLSIAAHLREHPPVDEAQVKAIQDVTAQADKEWGGSWVDPAESRKYAERLYELGLRVEVAS